MTAKQKENIKRFKAVQAEAKKLKAKNKKLTHVQAVKQAWAIMLGKKKTKVTGVKKKHKKPSESVILNKIHKVKKDVEKLDEAQHKHMSIGKIKSAGIGALKHKYGSLAAKKITEKTNRGKKAISKELREIANKIKKLHSL